MTAGPDDKTVFFGGAESSRKSYYLHGGAIHAPGGLGSSGVVLRGFLGTGGYSYHTRAVFGGEVDGKGFDADAMVGYQIFSGSLRYSGYVGGAYKDNDLSPEDRRNDTRDDSFGIKGQAEFETTDPSSVYLGGIGSWSTADDTYWARLRAGGHSGEWTFGPEGLLLGNEEYDAYRAGVFVNLPIKDLLRGEFFGVKLSVSGGYENKDGNNRSDETGAYGAIGFSMDY